MADISGYMINGELKTFADTTARQGLLGKQDRCLQGHGEPTEEGEYIGQIYLDLDTDKFYIVNSSNEWQLIGSGEEAEDKTPIIITRSQEGEWTADDWNKLESMRNGQAILRLVGGSGSRIHCNPIQAIREVVDGVQVYRCFFYSQFDINHVWRLTYTPSEDGPKASDLMATRIQLAVSIAPPCVGLVHYVSSTGKTYISKGTSSTSDWIEINGGSEPGPEPTDNVLVVDVDSECYEEVAEAYAESKAIFAKATFANRSLMLALAKKESGVYVFTCIDEARNVFFAQLNDENIWDFSNYSVVSASALTNETQARQNADANLQGQIDNRYTKAATEQLIKNELPFFAVRKSNGDWDINAEDANKMHKWKVGNIYVREQHDAEGSTVDIVRPIQFNSWIDDDGLKHWDTYFYSLYQKYIYRLSLKENEDETTTYSASEMALERPGAPNFPACPGMLYKNTSTDEQFICTKFNDHTAWLKLNGEPLDNVVVVLYGDSAWTTANDAFMDDKAVFCKDIQEGQEVMYPIISKDTATGLLTFGNALTQFTLSQTNQWHTYTNNFANVKASIASAPTHVGDIAVTSDKKVYVATGITSASDWKELGNGGGEEPVEEIFIAEYEATTYDEVKEAIAAGKTVFAKRDDDSGSHEIAVLGNCNDGQDLYFSYTIGHTIVTFMLNDDDEWTRIQHVMKDDDEFNEQFTVGSGAPTTEPRYLPQYYLDKTNGDLYVAKARTEDLSDWVKIGGSGGGIPDAPVDGKRYLRKNGAWVELDEGDKLWVHWLNVDGWDEAFDDNHHLLSTDQFSIAEGELVDSDKPHLEPGLYHFDMTVSYKPNRLEGASAELHKIDVTLQYGTKALYSHSSIYDGTLLGTISDFIVQVYQMSGVFRLDEEGDIDVKLTVAADEWTPFDAKWDNLYIYKISD